MPSHQFGQYFRITTWGESHGVSMGVVIDGCPAGVTMNAEVIQSMLDERAPGKALTSPRKEPDQVEIHSGVFQGKTTGAPIALVIYNREARPKDYDAIKTVMRPGHANYTYLKKYGIFDYRGGGRASARETVSRVAAAAVAKQWVQTFGIDLVASVVAMGDVRFKGQYPEDCETLRQKRAMHATRCHDDKTHTQMQALLLGAQAEGDSLGAEVRLWITGLPIGLGDPVFEKFEAKLAHAMMSIPATKGFSLGEGFQAVTMKGSQHNDGMMPSEEAPFLSNHSGGTLGGITNGMPIECQIAFKPTSSIRKPQQTIDDEGQPVTLEFSAQSRHDPCVGIRGVTVVEAMAYLVIADCLLAQRLVLAHPDIDHKD